MRSTSPPSYDERLTRALLDDEDDALQAGVTLFERHAPQSLAQALALLASHGPPSPEALEHATRAYDVYRHVHDMPCD